LSNFNNKPLYLKGFWLLKTKKAHKTIPLQELLLVYSLTNLSVLLLAALQLEPTKVENILPPFSYKSRPPRTLKTIDYSKPPQKFFDELKHLKT
jgi:hypothetical protein